MSYKQEKTVMLRFQKGVKLVKEGERVGAVLNGRTIWARDDMTGRILRQVIKKARCAETYASEQAGTESDNRKASMALSIVSFIMDFGDFLKPA